MVQRLPEVQKQFALQGAEVATMTPAGFGELMASELSRWEKVIKQRGIKAE